MRVGILVFDDVEELDFVGPLEVFGVASRLAGDLDLITVSKQGQPIRGRYGLRVQPDYSYSSCPPLDMLVIPGGKGARDVARYDEETLAFVRGHAERAPVASVCTGALILAEAGLLRGQRCTTHWSALDLLRQYPGAQVMDGMRFVRANGVATSAGVSAGIDLALDLVREWFGDNLRDQVARQMEYSLPSAPAT